MLNSYRYLEERSEAILIAQREPGWLSTRGVERLIRWMRPLIVVRRCRVREPKWRPTDDGRSRILIPEEAGRWQWCRYVLHELGHPLLDVGLADVVQDAAPEERRRFRIATQAGRWEEELAERFTVCLQLPARRVQALRDPHEIALETGLPWRVVHRRTRELAGECFQLRTVPHWSAARAFTLGEQTGPAAALWLLQGDIAHVRIPVDRANRQRRFHRLRADLVALRPAEMLAKYRQFAAESQPYTSLPSLEIDMEELRAWAGFPP